MDLEYPYGFDARGRTTTAGSDAHIRQMIEQVLFTSPGERVNRPDFGSGILQLVFAPNSGVLAEATQFLVQGSLQQWLGEVIRVERVEVSTEDAVLHVKVSYVVRATERAATAEFTRKTG